MDDDDDDDVVAMPQNVPCISPDMPSCASGMSGKNIHILMLPAQLNLINSMKFASLKSCFSVLTLSSQLHNHWECILNSSVTVKCFM